MSLFFIAGAQKDGSLTGEVWGHFCEGDVDEGYFLTEDKSSTFN